MIIKQQITKSELVELAIKAGFDAPESHGLSGSSADDELIYVEEYPVGEPIINLLKLLGLEVTE